MLTDNDTQFTVVKNGVVYIFEKIVSQICQAHKQDLITLKEFSQLVDSIPQRYSNGSVNSAWLKRHGPILPEEHKK